ncbi:MAG: virulence plasmid protein B, partial [Candidatus Peregrinibacteria bacterium GW2011_GWF2_33_10]
MIKLFTKFVSVTIILQLLIGNSAVVLAAKVKDEIIKENKEIIKEENLEIVDSNKIENSENTKNKTDLKEKVKEKVDEIKDKTDTGDEDPAIKEGDPTPTTEIPPQNPEPQNPLDFLKGFQGKYETDLFTGASTFNYQIWLPKGRNLNPSISIGYSSSNTNLNGIIGYGWDISNSYIFRNATKGVDKIYNSDDFSAVIFGGYNELVSLGSGVYGAKTESDFKKWQFSNNTWTVTDTNGTIYTFGSTSSSRQDNPNDFSKIFKWMLEKVQDTNGNFISFTYSKDSGQIYPDKIRYTGNGSDQGIYEVKFNLVARNSSVSSFRTGFEVKTNFLIDNIKINSYDTGFSKEIRAYKFGYTYNGALAQLTKITVYGGTESFPDTKFSYFPNNLLKKVELPAGGIFQLTYKKSSAYRESDQSLANENLPFPIDTVHSESLQASSADIAYTTYYDYEGGHYYYDNLDAYKKEYAGFHSIAITDPLNNKKKLSFHQSEFSKDNINSVLNGEYDDHISKKGKIYREEFYDNLGKLFKLIIRKWDKKTLTGTNRYFVFLKNQIEIDYDGDSSYKAKANAYEYDNYGNFLKNTDYGEVSLNSDGYNFTDVLNDKIVQDIEYASNSSKYIYALPQKQTLTDYYSNKIGETKIYYDKLSLGSVDKGNLTKTEKLVDSTGKIIKNEIDYNSFGLPNKYRNGKNYQTEIIYDSFNLFPYQIKNPKSQITTFTYNYFFGQISQITDPNNSKKVFQYDGLGRLKEVDLSNPHADSGTIKKTGYTYDTISYPNSVTQTDTAYNVDVNSKVIYVTTKIYFDGLNRKIQIRHETEGTDKYIVSSIIYDELGNLKKELLPKVLSGLSFSTPSLSDIGNQYSYDCLNRILQISNVLGATTFSYNDWKKTLIDANSKKKEFLYDARGNLTQVNEFLNSVSYATKYEYDFLKNLTKITDASGNIKNFTYDLLGRNLSQEILHKPTETNFKKYTFQYDDNNNLLIQTDPKGQIVNYSYDELDRILTEDFPNDAGVNVQYVYDQGIYGVGRLSSVMNYDYNYQSDYIFEKSFTYDILGRVLSDSEIFKQGNINKIYTTSYDYDFLGNIFNTIYPDSTEVLYIYDNSDKVEKILLNNQTLISKIDHSAIGTISEIDYVNGVISKNTYDINKLYRLTRKQTYKNSTYLQNISYSFDAVGNVLNITDSSNTNSAKIADYTYDDLHRLSTAIITNTPQNKNYIETYAYDITGNILVKSDLGNYQYNDKNPQAVTRAGNVSYSY